MAEQFSLTIAGSRKRLLKDKLAEYGIKMGGGVVLMTLLLIFFYLLYVVYPVFESAKVESKAQYSQSFAGTTYALATTRDKLFMRPDSSSPISVTISCLSITKPYVRNSS